MFWKKRETNARFMDETKGFKYLSVETRLLFVTSYYNFWLRAWGSSTNKNSHLLGLQKITTFV